MSALRHHNTCARKHVDNLGDGIYNWGTVFELSPTSDGSWMETVLQSFENEESELIAGLIFNAAGNLYGTAPVTIAGTGFGIAFELTPNSNGWTESVLYRFCSIDRCPDGAGPAAPLTFDHGGNLYGTTTGGGTCCGVVFKLAPNSNGQWKETVVHNFLDHPGANPNAGLILDSDGNLYGTTTGDGRTTFGSVFEITP